MTHAGTLLALVVLFWAVRPVRTLPPNPEAGAAGRRRLPQCVWHKAEAACVAGPGLLLSTLDAPPTSAAALAALRPLAFTELCAVRAASRDDCLAAAREDGCVWNDTVTPPACDLDPAVLADRVGQMIAAASAALEKPGGRGRKQLRDAAFERRARFCEAGAAGRRACAALGAACMWRDVVVGAAAAAGQYGGGGTGIGGRGATGSGGASSAGGAATPGDVSDDACVLSAAGLVAAVVGPARARESAAARAAAACAHMKGERDCAGVGFFKASLPRIRAFGDADVGRALAIAPAAANWSALGGGGGGAAGAPLVKLPDAMEEEVAAAATSSSAAAVRPQQRRRQAAVLAAAVVAFLLWC